MTIDAQQLKRSLDEAGISWREVEGGCVLEYRDGVASELVAFAEEERGAEEVVREFQEIDVRRFRLTNAMRWLLAERKLYLDRSVGHTWHYGDVGFSSEFNVYEDLNRSLKKCADDVDAFEDWLERAWIRPESSEKKKIVGWLNKDGPPENEIEYDEDPFENYGSKFIDEALACARGDFTAFLDTLEDGEKYKYTAEMAEAFAKTRGMDPGSKLIRRIAEKLPGVEVSHDLSKPGKISFTFQDGEDDYDLVVRGKKLSREIDKLGLEDAAEEFATEYRDLGKKRIQFLNALSKLMGNRGYFRDGGGFPETEWVFGRECREFSIPIGKSLTNKLKKHQPEELLNKILVEQQLRQVTRGELEESLKAGKDDALDWNHYPKVFGEPPFRVADKWVHRVRAGLCDDAGEDEREDLIGGATNLRRQEIERFFTGDEIALIKMICAEKLLCLDEELPSIEEDVLEVAEEMGWRQLGLELLQQPWFSRVFYEPESGLMNAGEILQWLSLICPGPEVAKHCGRILQMSPKNVAERLKLKKFCNVDMEDIQSSLVRESQAETAIAWLRCREVMMT